jgi:hypothetical protein
MLYSHCFYILYEHFANHRARHAANEAQCAATAAGISITNVVYNNNVATLWGNTVASDVCGVGFAAAIPATVASGKAMNDTNGAVPVLLARDFYGATVITENALEVSVADPVSSPLSGSYWYIGSNVTMKAGTAALTDLIIGAQPRSAFNFTATAYSNSTGIPRMFTTSFTVHTKNCQPGSYRELSAVNATLVYTCLSCPIGTYGNLVESPSCKTCTAGNFCAVGSAVQTACPARYTSSIGSGTCVCDVDFVGMSSVTGCSTSSTLINGTVDCPTDGSAVLTIHGDNFGEFNTVAVRYHLHVSLYICVYLLQHCERFIGSMHLTWCNVLVLNVKRLMLTLCIGTGALAVSVGGRQCVVLEAFMDLSVQNQAGDDCIPPKGFARCQLPAGTGKSLSTIYITML